MGWIQPPSARLCVKPCLFIWGFSIIEDGYSIKARCHNPDLFSQCTDKNKHLFDINLNNCLEQTILRQGQLYLFVAQQSLALQCICYSKLAYSSKFIGVFSHEKYNLIGSAVRYIIASDEQTGGQADRQKDWQNDRQTAVQKDWQNDWQLDEQTHRETEISLFWIINSVYSCLNNFNVRPESNHRRTYSLINRVGKQPHELYMPQFLS